MGKIIAVDYGQKWIGLAGADDKLKIAHPLEVIPKASTPLEDAENIIKAAQKYFEKIDLIIIGIPLTKDGKETKIAKISRELAEAITSKYKIKVAFQDERLTSEEAERRLLEKAGSLSRFIRKKRAEIDAIAAAIILEDYLSLHNNT